MKHSNDRKYYYYIQNYPVLFKPKTIKYTQAVVLFQYQSQHMSHVFEERVFVRNNPAANSIAPLKPASQTSSIKSWDCNNVGKCSFFFF